MTLRRIKLIGAAAGATLAAGAVVAGAWAVADKLGVRPTFISEHRELEQLVGAIKQQRDQDRWFYLDRKRSTSGGLTQAEFQEWCTLGLRLGFLTTCRK